MNEAPQATSSHVLSQTKAYTKPDQGQDPLEPIHAEVIRKVEEMLHGLDLSIPFATDTVWSLITSDVHNPVFQWDNTREVQVIHHGPDYLRTTDLSKAEEHRIQTALAHRTSRLVTSRHSNENRSWDASRRLEIVRGAMNDLYNHVYSEESRSTAYTYRALARDIKTGLTTDTQGFEVWVFYPWISEGMVQSETHYGLVCTVMTPLESQMMGLALDDAESRFQSST